MGWTFFIIACVCIAIVVFLVLLVLFEPGLEYKVAAPSFPLDSEPFLCLLGLLADSKIHRQSQMEVLTNGDVFYEEELKAIRAAKRSICLEAYIFAKGEVTRQFIEAMAERARAGVKVNVVLDAIGSFATWDRYFKELREAGGRVCWYQPLRWRHFRQWNNRTHRELLIVDGEVGFVGGAGVADWWYKDTKKQPQWRDTMFRVRGDMVDGLQNAFVENWLEAADEILTGEEYFPFCANGRGGDGVGKTVGINVISSPSAGRSNRSRIVFQTLIASARRFVHITSPYFLPDRSGRAEILNAVKRGVKVTVLVPGDHADHLLTRRSSRRRYGELLEGGVEIYEYQPAMIHAKVLVVDGVWSVVGTTNFDNRSFGLNDEVNLAACDEELAARLEQDFQEDLAKSKRINLEEWRRRPLRERVVELSGWILERHS